MTQTVTTKVLIIGAPYTPLILANAGIQCFG